MGENAERKNDPYYEREDFTVNKKKTAVLIYPQFCNFEISVALEILALGEKPVTIFAKTKEAVRSEEGLCVVPDAEIGDLCPEEFDSLLLPGAMDIRESVEDEAVLDFIRAFDREDMVIGAISIAPVLLLKAGILKDKPFMAGINQEELLEEGFTREELALMKGWDDNLKAPSAKGYLVSGTILTSLSCYFVKWALEFGKMLGIEMSEKTFGFGF